MSEWIKVTPLGGLDEIGSNMIHISSKNDSIVIDCGILFPDSDSYGINYLIPDFNHLKKVDSIIFTHGHEDHIGACSHFFKQLPKAKVYASKFTEQLINDKLKHDGTIKKITLFNDQSTISFKDFDIFPIRVNHSIPETFGMLIRSKDQKNALFYVSDFKVDPKTPYEKEFDFKRLIELSKNCTDRLLMPDSTNIISSNLKTKSEADLIENFEKLIGDNYKNIFITTFASNIHRLQTILTISKKYKRKVIFAGRSLFKYTKIASETNLLTNLDVVVDSEYFNPNDKFTIILSGCQGDFKSALNRVLSENDKYLKISDGDVFLYSAKAIPGNEKKIANVFNKITKLGAKIIVGEKEGFHASGHAGRDDLKLLIDKYKPSSYIPCHGETFFLKKHQEFIQTEYPKIKTYLLSNGHTSLISKGNILIKYNDIFPPILIAGSGHEIKRQEVSKRRKIATQGLICVSLYKRSDIKIYISGLPTDIVTTQSVFKTVSDILSKTHKQQYEKVVEEIRVAVRREAGDKLGYRPVCIIQAHN